MACKKRGRIGRLLSLFLCLTALSSAFSEVGESPYYRKPLYDTGITVMLRPTMQFTEVEDSPEFKALLFTDADMPEANFLYFAIYAPEFVDADMAQLSDEETLALLAYVSDDPSGLSYYLEEAFADGENVLRVYDSGQTESVHLMTMQGEWLLNLTTIPAVSGNKLSARQLALQRELLKTALDTDWQEPVYEVAIPGTSMRMQLPQGMPMVLYAQGEGTLDGFVLNPANPDVALFSFFAETHENYADQSVLTLGAAWEEAIIGRFTVDEAPELTTDEAFAGGIGMVTLRSGQATHMLTMHEGWLVCLSFAHASEVDADVALSLQCKLLENIVLSGGTSAEIPEAQR